MATMVPVLRSTPPDEPPSAPAAFWADSLFGSVGSPGAVAGFKGGLEPEVVRGKEFDVAAGEAVAVIVD